MTVELVCPDCNVKLSRARAATSVWHCPCCSSRWRPGGRTHWGSHNDWATYLCDRTLSGLIRRFIWHNFTVVLNQRWQRDHHVS